MLSGFVVCCYFIFVGGGNFYTFCQSLTLPPPTHTQKKIAGDSKCTLPPDFVIPRSLSTLYRCLLTTLAQDKPYHEKPLGTATTARGAVPRLYLTIAARISSLSFV